MAKKEDPLNPLANYENTLDPVGSATREIERQMAATKVEQLAIASPLKSPFALTDSLRDLQVSKNISAADMIRNSQIPRAVSAAAMLAEQLNAASTIPDRLNATQSIPSSVFQAQREWAEIQSSLPEDVLAPSFPEQSIREEAKQLFESTRELESRWSQSRWILENSTRDPDLASAIEKHQGLYDSLREDLETYPPIARELAERWNFLQNAVEEHGYGSADWFMSLTLTTDPPTLARQIELHSSAVPSADSLHLAAELQRYRLANSPLFDLHSSLYEERFDMFRSVNDAILNSEAASFLYRFDAVEGIQPHDQTARGPDPEPEEPFSDEEDERLIEVVPAAALQRLEQVRYLPQKDILAIRRDPRLMRNISPRNFELLIAEILDGLGYSEIIVTPQSKDGGIDIYATKEVDGIPIIFAFECKRYAQANRIGVDIARLLLGAVTDNSQNPSIGVLVTTSYFTSGALTFMGSNARIRGRDFDGVVDWIKEYSRK